MKIWHIIYSTNKDPTKNICTDTYTSIHRYEENIENMRAHFQTKTVSFLHSYSVSFEPGQVNTQIQILNWVVQQPAKVLELNTTLCP